MIIFWSAVLAVVVVVLVLAWRHDRKAKARGSSVRSAGAMTGASQELRRDARVAADQSAWSKTAAAYTSEQLTERNARRDAEGPR